MSLLEAPSAAPVANGQPEVLPAKPAAAGARSAQFEVRPCLRQDLPAVVPLLLQDGVITPGVSRQDIEAYAAKVYFDSPWFNPDIPSLVCVDANGRLEGFVGVIPRRMRLGHEVVAVAVPGNFVVRSGPDGKVNGFAALAMLKRLFAGPQSLTFTDTANEASRRLWEAAGAINPGLYSLDWFRPIKPATAVIQMMETARGVPMPMAGAVGLATRAVDLAGGPLLARMARNKAAAFSIESLDRDGLLALLDKRARHVVLAGCYDPATLDWLLGEVAAKAAGGTLRQGILVDDQGARCGAYIYLLKPGGIAQVLLHVAREDRFDLLLQAMVSDAAALGATVLTGAVQPRQLPAYKGQRSFMMCNQWTLMHSRRPEVLEPFFRNTARLSALDGERWTRFADLFSI